MTDTMTAAAKQRVRDEWVARARAAAESWTTNVAATSAAATVDEDESHDIDATWQADTDGDLAGIFSEQGYAQRLDLNILEQIDFSLTDVVRPGAIVGIDGHRDVVGISGEPFEVDGVTYETISTESPLYAVIEGLRLGDTYEFRGQQHTIDFLA